MSRRKFKIGYSGRYIDEDGEEMVFVTSGIEAGISDKDHLVEIFQMMVDEIASEYVGDITKFTFTIKLIEDGQPTTTDTSKA